MYDYDFEEEWSDICPMCHVGRKRMTSRPYLKLFHGQLFTIPDALCYHCDMCQYYEFDDTNFDIISEMMFAATRPYHHDEPTRSVLTVHDDEMPSTGKLPRL